jgi:hypothetical protein
MKISGTMRRLAQRERATARVRRHAIRAASDDQSERAERVLAIISEWTGIIECRGCRPYELRTQDALTIRKVNALLSDWARGDAYRQWRVTEVIDRFNRSTGGVIPNFGPKP